MIRNYFKSFFRFIGKHKAYTLNNLLGLSIGMASAVIIYLWILDELSFDTFHEKYDNLYRFVQTQHYEDGDFLVAATPAIMAPTFEDLFPEIIETARFRPGLPEVLVSYEDKKFYEHRVAFADKEFFKLFSYPFIHGSPENPFPDINSVLITEHIANKYFGDEDPIGKTIYINKTEIYTITGILKNIPANSHLQFDILGNFEILDSYGYYLGWNNNYYYGYALLQDGADYKSLGPKFDQYMRDNDINDVTNFWLQPLSEIHLHSDFDIDVYSHTEPTNQYILIFYIIGFLIILIAIINYINLSTARSTRRALEVGIRKVHGASRPQLIRQFMGESFFLVFLSYLIAMLLVELALPAFNNFTGKDVFVNYLNLQFTLGMIVLILITGMISGGYPSLFLSSYSPVRIIKGNIKAGPATFRQILVVIQFSIAIMMIVCTGIIYKQLTYIQNINLGLEKELILYSRIRGNLYREYNTFKQELLKYPGINGVTYCSNLPTYNVASTSGIGWEGKSEETSVLVHRFIVDHDYIPTFGIEMAAGRNFSLDHPSDSNDYILNEAAIRQMGMEDPIGKRFRLWDMEGKIIGIAKDFNYKSVHKEIEPLCLYLDRDDRTFGYIYLNIEDNNIFNTLNNIEKVSSKINPFYPMDFQFLNVEYEKLYTDEQKLRTLFTLFATLAIFLSCLGLIGLSSFMTEKRAKEIGIRKAMGSNSWQIMKLFSWDTLKWILISNIIAWPVAWVYMKQWLNDFAYKTSIKPWIFLIAGLTVMVIAVLAVSSQAFRTARINPAESLKNE